MNDRLRYRAARFFEGLLRFPPTRQAFVGFAVAGHGVLRVLRRRDAARRAVLLTSRLLAGIHGAAASAAVRRLEERVIQECRHTENPLRAEFQRRDAAAICQEFRGYGTEYASALKFPRPKEDPCREGDLIVLKPRVSVAEKGVVLVKYNDAFERFAALYDLERLAAAYRIVLEPSTWGYADAAILMYLGLPTDVIVQAQHHADREFIDRVGGNLTAIPLGAADWVDPEVFVALEPSRRDIDVIMVASWLSLKRHDVLFRAVRHARKVVRRLVLVGYASGGRTSEDIRKEARVAGVADLIEIHERIPPTEVASLLSRSKVSVMLARREGANKALSESLFAGTPVVVTADNIGVNREMVNAATGRFATDSELSRAIIETVSGARDYRPREWALANTGYLNSTRKLEDAVRGLAQRDNEDWTRPLFRKKNMPNLVFADDGERRQARQALQELRRFLRGT